MTEPTHTSGTPNAEAVDDSAAGLTADVTDLLPKSASASRALTRPSPDMTSPADGSDIPVLPTIASATPASLAPDASQLRPAARDAAMLDRSPSSGGAHADHRRGDNAGELAADLVAGAGQGLRFPRTHRGARAFDRALADEAAAAAAIRQATAKQAAELSALRVAQARAEARAQARQRAQWRRESERAARSRHRAERLSQIVTACRDRRAMAVVVPMMLASGLVAWPAQYGAYQNATGSAWAASAIAAMVEGGTWLGAALESLAIERRRPAGRYRLLTWSAAGIAAIVNLTHGVHQDGGWALGVTYGCASLWGVTAWTAYVHLRTDIHTGPRGRRDDMHRPTRSQWLRYPRMSWRALSLRIAVGPDLTHEEAWHQVWARRRRHPRWMGKTLRSRPPVSPGTSPDPIDLDAPFDPIHHPGPIGASDPTGPTVQTEPTGQPDQEDRSADGSGPDRVSRRRTLPEVEAELRTAMDAGRLPTRPTADEIRVVLRVGPKRARHLRDVARGAAQTHTRRPPHEPIGPGRLN